MQLTIPAWVWIVIGMLFVIPFGDVYVRMVSKAMELVVRVSNPLNKIIHTVILKFPSNGRLFKGAQSPHSLSHFGYK